MNEQTKKLCKQALEALEYHVEQTRPIDRTSKAIIALKSALADLDYWQEEARRYAENADYWRKRYETLATEPKLQCKPLTEEDDGVCRHCDGSGCVACDARCLPEQTVLHACAAAIRARGNT